MPQRTGRDSRLMRHKRIRRHLAGDGARPRLSVFRSLKHISVQVIDDEQGKTLASASSLEKAIGAGGKRDGAAKVGELIAKRALEAGIKTVVFDRGGFRYSGRIATLAESARKAGLEF